MNTMASSIACVHCGSNVAADVQEAAIVTKFLDDPLSSVAVLQRGLGAVACPVCSLPTSTPLHHIVLEHGRAVVGVRPERAGNRYLLLTAQLVKHLQRLGIRPIVAENAKSFRRLVISELMEPYGHLMNQFRASTNQTEWVRLNEAKLQPRFFVAMWLGTTGAMPVYMQEHQRDMELKPAFVPDELAPDDARHVVRRQEAIAHIERDIGRLIGINLGLFASQCVESERSLAPLDRLAQRLPAVVLTDRILSHVAEMIGEVVEHFEAMQTLDSIVMSYMIEAALALTCMAKEEDNPRRAQWSQRYLIYDLQRRLVNHDDALLPPVETLRRSLDSAAFWHTFRGLFRQTVSEPDSDHRKQVVKALFESAERVFPSELLAQVPLATRIDESLNDREAMDEARRILRRALGPPLNEIELEAAIAGVCRTHPAIATPLATELASGGTLGDDLRVLSMYCQFIEHLNGNGHPDVAIGLIGAGEDVMSRLDDGQESRAARAHFLNEVGNCLRFEGRLANAQECYELALDLIGGNQATPDRRVAVRNLAIVLRDQHRYVPATKLLEELLADASSAELPGLVTSLAICLSEVGLDRKALALMETHAPHLSGRAAFERDVIAYATEQAFLLARLGRLQEAHDLLSRGSLRAEAARRNFHATAITARDIELRLGNYDQANRDRLIEEQFAAFDGLQVHRFGVQLMMALQGLVALLVDTGQQKRAERLVRDFAESLDPEVEPRKWLLHRLVSRQAELRGSPASALELEQAVLDFQRGISTAAFSGDVREFLSPQSAEIRDLVATALSIKEHDDAATTRLWRHAADLAAAPVLTARLRHAASLPVGFYAPDEEDARVEALLASRVCALVQVVASGDSLRFVRTKRSGPNSLQSDLVDPGITLAEADRMARMLAFHLVRADPTASDLGLASLRGWPQFAERVRKGFAGLPEERWTVVIAGPVQEAALALALSGSRPLSFVPSLAAATALRERNKCLHSSRLPQKLFAFATWFTQEHPDEAAALASVADHVAQMGQRYGLDVSSVTASEATKERMLDGLASCDVAWIACHGRVRRDAATVELLVAADGRLPPANLAIGPSHIDERHAVGWEALVALAQAPAVVISSACDSGLAITNTAGERLGLERALLPAGTAVFIAPLWPVPTVAIQSIVRRLLDAWISQPDVAWTEHLHRIRVACLREGAPALAAEALSVFGELPT